MKDAEQDLKGVGRAEEILSSEDASFGGLDDFGPGRSHRWAGLEGQHDDTHRRHHPHLSRFPAHIPPIPSN